MSSKIIRKAVVPAAGLGTRFLPATKSIPKELLPIVDVPIIQHIVKEAVDAGIEQVILITGRGKSAIVDHFDVHPELEAKLAGEGKKDLLEALKETNSLVKIVSVRQQEPKGLGHAVLCAKEIVGDEPFAVMLGDDLVDAPVPCIQQMVQVYEKEKKGVVALMRVADRDVPKFGICGGISTEERVYELDAMVEKPSIEAAPSNLAIVGRYILEPQIFDYLENATPGAQGEIQLTDAMAAMMRERGFVGFEFRGKRYDAGDKLGFLQASIAYALKRPDLAAHLKSFMRELV